MMFNESNTEEELNDEIDRLIEVRNKKVQEKRMAEGGQFRYQVQWKELTDWSDGDPYLQTYDVSLNYSSWVPEHKTQLEAIDEEIDNHQSYLDNRQRMVSELKELRKQYE